MKNEHYKEIKQFFIFGIISLLISLYTFMHSLIIKDGIAIFIAGLCSVSSFILIIQCHLHAICYDLKLNWEDRANDWKKSYLEIQNILLEEMKKCNKI